MGTQDSLGVPAQAPSGSPLQPAVSAAIPNAVDELRKAIRLLNNAAYKCGKTDGRDAPITLQQKHADANDAALAKAMAAVDTAMTEACAEGRKDEAEDGAERMGVAADTLDNLLSAMTLPMPAQFHLDCLRPQLERLRDELRATGTQA